MALLDRFIFREKARVLKLYEEDPNSSHKCAFPRLSGLLVLKSYSC